MTKAAHNHRIRSLARIIAPLETIALLAMVAAPARPQWLGLQAQTQYEFDQVNRREGGITGRGFMATTYTLSLRRKFMPGSALISDLSLNGTGNGGSNGTQNTRGWTLNLLSQQSRYMLNGRIVRNNYASNFGAGDSSGVNTYYNLGLFLRQPAWPVVSVQFQRNAARTRFEDLSAGNTASTWLTSLSYAAAPVRFSYDRSQQTVSSTGSPGSRVTSQTGAITMDQPLLQGLDLFGELSRSSTDVSFAAGSTAMKTTRRTLRLTATPTRSMVAEMDLTSEANDQRVSLTRGRNHSTTLGWSIRSEILPGLSLDLEDQRQSQNGAGFFGGFDTVTRNQNASVAARLARGTILSSTASRIRFGGSIAGTDVRQDSLQTSLQTALGHYTDLTVNLGRNNSVTGGSDRFDNTSQGISIRDRRSSRMTMGVGYRRMKIKSSGVGSDDFNQHGDAVDLDTLFQAGYAMSLGVRLSYQNNKGSSPFKTIAPGVNLRLQVDPSTNLTASWNSQRFRQYDPLSAISFGQDTRGLSARLTHTFVNGSFLDLAYDFQGNSLSDVRWRRQLRIGFTINR